MKSRLFAFVLALTLSGIAMVQTWNTATSTNDTNGRVIIFRFISEFAPNFQRSDQPVRVIIAWKYDGTNGMPTREERERMDAMEDLLAPVVEAGAFASLPLVSTGENLREWIYYAMSADDFLVRLNQALREQPAFPIEVHTADDPTWSNYQAFIDGLQA